MTNLIETLTRGDIKFDFLRYANTWAARTEQRKELAGIPNHLLTDMGITQADRTAELQKSAQRVLLCLRMCFHPTNSQQKSCWAIGDVLTVQDARALLRAWWLCAGLGWESGHFVNSTFQK